MEETPTIRYRRVRFVKYETDAPVSVFTRLYGHDISTKYLRLKPDGWLTILAGYRWDGPSGPALDTPSFMRASLAHDALYQLIRTDHLPEAGTRRIADNLMRRLCAEDGMPWWRRWWTWRAVRKFGDDAVKPDHFKIKEAP